MADGLTTPPRNIEAEEAVIGSVLIDPLTFDDCGLRPDDFYLVKHRWIWETFAALINARREIDLLTVQEELDRRGQLGEIGGPPYITRLITLTPTAYNAPSYAALVREAATRRALIATASEIAKAAYDDERDVAGIGPYFASALDNLSAASGQNVDAFDAAAAWFTEMQLYLTSGNKLLGLTTGYGAIDDKTKGIKRGELTILCAEPSMGKSSLAFQMVYRQCKQGLRVGIFSQEMRREDVIERMAMACLNAHADKLRPGDLPDLKVAADDIALLPFVVNGESGLTTADIARDTREMARTLHGLDVIVIDHLGYINHAGEKYDNLATRIGLTTKALARLAKQMNIAVVALCQLKRNPSRGADTPPSLNDLRDSGNIEADARMVLALHRPEYYSDPDTVDLDAPQDAWIVVLKNHRGPRNVTAKLQFIESSAQFGERI